MTTKATRIATGHYTYKGYTLRKGSAYWRTDCLNWCGADTKRDLMTIIDDKVSAQEQRSGSAIIENPKLELDQLKVLEAK